MQQTAKTLLMSTVLTLSGLFMSIESVSANPCYRYQNIYQQAQCIRMLQIQQIQQIQQNQQQQYQQQQYNRRQQGSGNYSGQLEIGPFGTYMSDGKCSFVSGIPVGDCN